MLISVNGFARYTKIYISFGLLIPKKWEYPATCWSWGCQISQLLLHPAAYNNMQYTTRILRLRSPSSGLNKSCLGCHSLDAYVIWPMGPSWSAGPTITEVSVWGIGMLNVRILFRQNGYSIRYIRHAGCKVSYVVYPRIPFLWDVTFCEWIIGSQCCDIIRHMK